MLRKQGLPNKNKSVHFRRIFVFISAFGKICFEQFQKVDVSTLPRYDWAFLGENKTGLEFCPSILWLKRWPLAHFVKNVNAKIRLGGPKSGWTCPFSSKRWKETIILWRFFQREKEKRSNPVRRQAKIGAGYLSSPPVNWLSLHKLHKDHTWSLKIDCVFVLLVV